MAKKRLAQSLQTELMRVDKSTYSEGGLTLYMSRNLQIGIHQLTLYKQFLLISTPLASVVPVKYYIHIHRGREL